MLRAVVGGTSSGGGGGGGGSLARTMASNRGSLSWARGGNMTNRSVGYRIAGHTPVGAAWTGLEMTFANYLPAVGASAEDTNTAPFTLRCSIEYPIGTIYPATFGGVSSILVNAGDNVTCDPIAGLALPANTQFFMRVSLDLNNAGATYQLLQNQYCPIQRTNEGLNSNAGFVDYSIAGPTFNGFTSTPAYVYGPISISGIPSIPGNKSFAIFGDSIADGIGDSYTTPQQSVGDYYNTLNGTAPFFSYGNVGWVEMGLTNKGGIVNLSIPGRQVDSYATAIANTRAYTALDLCPPTHLIIQACTNDMFGGLNATQIITRMQTIATNARTRWGSGLKVYPCTMVPRTVFTDTWETLAGQTPVAPGGSTYYTDTGGTTGRIYFNSQVRGGLSFADGFLDPSVQVENATDPRLWEAGTTVPPYANGSQTRLTGDGIHPNVPGHAKCYNAAAGVTF